MNPAVPALFIMSCALSAALGGLLAHRRGELRRRAALVDRDALRSRIAELTGEVNELTARVRTEDQMGDLFSSLAGTTLAAASEQLAARSDHQWDMRGQHLLAELGKHTEALRRLEQERRDDSTGMRSAVEMLTRSTSGVQNETRSLATALRDNAVRGLWGETQLRRVLESTGMLANCDFVEQLGVGTTGRTGRPDVVVHLPHERRLVIDAKAPLTEYLSAANAADPDLRRTHLGAHARSVAQHAKTLAGRDYTAMVDGSVDLVVMYLPGDAFLSAALEGHPGLLEECFAAGVVPASPATLFGLLRGVAAGWREQRVSEEAERIAELGRELHQRIGTFARHFDDVGRALTKATTSYNRAVGSMETRLLVTARQFEDLGAGSAGPTAPAQAVDELPRPPASPELLGGDDAGAA